MRVKLRDLLPNPTRNFAVDPVDEGAVAELVESIKDDGFWGGVVCNQVGKNGPIHIIAGQSRREAGLKAGIEEADLFVDRDMPRKKMIRIYARENATQRGNKGTALTGSVASAIHAIAKDLLAPNGDSGTAAPESQKTRGHLLKSDGIGHVAVEKYLSGVPGLDERSIKESLHVLKRSGDYARIIAAVREEIQREHAEEIAALARAEAERAAAEEEEKAALEKGDERKAEAARGRRRKAEEDAKEHEEAGKVCMTANEAVENAKKHNKQDFDLKGVSKYLKDPAHVAFFEKCVTGEGIKPYLPIKNQAEVARRIVQMTTTQNGHDSKRDTKKVPELTKDFIREQVAAVVLNIGREERRLSREQQRELEKKNQLAKFLRHQDFFARNCRGMISMGMAMLDDLKGWPKGETVAFSKEFKTRLADAKRVLDRLFAKL
jgi:hypothetical protein